MQAKAREAIVVGYSREKRGYRLLDSKTRKAFYSHTAVFYEDKPGRIAEGVTPALNTGVSTQQYFNMDSAAMESIPAMLDEMHADRESACASDEHQDLPGGADIDDGSARTGGAGGAVAGGVVSVTESRKRGRDDVSQNCEHPSKRMRSEIAPSSAAVRGAELHEQGSHEDRLRGGCEPECETSGKAKRKKKKRSRGRRQQRLKLVKGCCVENHRPRSRLHLRRLVR